MFEGFEEFEVPDSVIEESCKNRMLDIQVKLTIR